MQRSLSSTMRLESSWNFVEWSLASTDTDGAPLYSKW
jgi:hypothetical protein